MLHLVDPQLTLICNGEIYNYKRLALRYGFQLQTGSDCEVILNLFKTFGIERTVVELDGVSTMKRSWHQIIRRFVNRQISEEELHRNAPKYSHCTPVLKKVITTRGCMNNSSGNMTI